MPHQGKIGRSIEMNNEFMVMDEEELLDVDGGAVWLVVGGVLVCLDVLHSEHITVIKILRIRKNKNLRGVLHARNH